MQLAVALALNDRFGPPPMEHGDPVTARQTLTRGFAPFDAPLRPMAALRDIAIDTYCNSLLVPLLFARRTLDRLLHREGSDVGFLPSALEWAFKKALLAEAALVRRGLSFPIGASVVALARRTA